MSNEHKFARITCRPEVGGFVLGTNHNLLEEGQVYEINDSLGVLMIRKVGPSVLTLDGTECFRKHGFSNGQSIQQLLHGGGRIFMTIDEAEGWYQECMAESRKR